LERKTYSYIAIRRKKGRSEGGRYPPFFHFISFFITFPFNLDVEARVGVCFAFYFFLRTVRGRAMQVELCNCDAICMIDLSCPVATEYIYIYKRVYIYI